jgi:NhaP-type Na+/H+ or K+/H+ antiporter
LIYLIEGMVFLITGLQARTLDRRHSAGTIRCRVRRLRRRRQRVVIGPLCLDVSGDLSSALARFPPIRARTPRRPGSGRSCLAFTGVRGIVSLAAALAIPFTTDSGRPFPGRDLILFLTFSVILVTLVGQGLMLPAVIRRSGSPMPVEREFHADRIEELLARRRPSRRHAERLERACRGTGAT